jgi:hypothetical protein
MLFTPKPSNAKSRLHHPNAPSICPFTSNLQLSARAKLFSRCCVETDSFWTSIDIAAKRKTQSGKQGRASLNVQILNVGLPYIIVFEPTVRSVCGIQVLVNYRLRHSSEGNVADALLDFIRTQFVFVKCGNCDIFFLEQNACCCARRLLCKRIAFEILIGLRRADNISSSSWRREWNLKLAEFCRRWRFK